jgi:hypothetical protein
METIYYVQGPTTRYNKYYRLWCIVCMYCNFILNDCKLDFNQEDITNSHWRDRIILSILLVKPKNDKEKKMMTKSHLAQ